MKRARFLLFAALFFNLARGLYARGLIINEIMYNPKGSDTYAEWVELYNASDAAIDISAWRFYDGSNHKFTAWRGALEIPAGGYCVIASSAGYFLQQNPDCPSVVIDTVMSLKNTSCAVALIDGFGVSADSLTYSSSWNNNAEGKSIEKKNFFLPSELASSWQESLVSGGTPGRANSSGAPEGGGGGGGVLSQAVYPVITEVAPCEAADFMEVLFLNGGTAPELYFFQGESCFRETEARTVGSGETWVIWFGSNASANTLHGAHFYSDKSGLTATDNVISVRDKGGGIIDVICYSNMDKDSFAPKKSYELAAAAGFWAPAVYGGTVSEYEDGCFNFKNGARGFSIKRKIAHNGRPLVSSPRTKADFFLSPALTPGYVSSMIEHKSPECFEIGGPNPFSPTDADPSKRLIKFSYKTNSPAAVKNIRIFDINGRERIKLAVDDITNSGMSLAGCAEGIVFWDGYEEGGVMCPVGVYIAFFESNDPSTGVKLKSKKSFVLGKKLK